MIGTLELGVLDRLQDEHPPLQRYGELRVFQVRAEFSAVLACDTREGLLEDANFDRSPDLRERFLPRVQPPMRTLNRYVDLVHTCIQAQADSGLPSV
ncbi:hypothetical protein AU195_09285 [Mycobacterium sp. IS-1496]|nr:hypothetical protein AU195_09285 [Mycobacterium sp. IS-1496]